MNVKITLAVDYLDLVWHSDKLFDELAINQFIAECAEKGIDELQWRVSALGDLLYYSNTPDRYHKDISLIEVDNEHSGKRQLVEKLNSIMHNFDPLKVACESAHKHNLRIVPWLTLFDDYGRFGESASSFVRGNPEKCWKHYDKEEYFPGILSYVWQESVDFRMTQIRELLKYDIDGLYLSNRTHSRLPSYTRKAKRYLKENPNNNMREFNKNYPDAVPSSIKESMHRFGFDIPAVEAYSEKYGQLPLPEDLTWWSFRGKYFQDFLRKVRGETDKRNISLSFGLRFTERNEEHVNSFSGLQIFPEGFFDWESFFTNRIIDEGHYMVESKKDFPELYPEITVTNPTQRMGWFWIGPRNFDNRRETGQMLLKALENKHIGGVVLFEAHSPLFYDSKHWDWINIFRGK